jgi:hypothetical protein
MGSGPIPWNLLEPELQMLLTWVMRGGAGAGRRGAVANLIKTCCLEGAAYDLVTSLGPERFTEWKAALINHAAGKVPNLFRALEAEVRNGNFQPGPTPSEGALEYRQLTPGYGITELVCLQPHGAAASTAHRPAKGGVDGNDRHIRGVTTAGN